MRMGHMIFWTRTNKMFKTITKDTLLLYPLIGCVVCAILGSLFIVIFLNRLPEMVPLYYSLPRTDERLAEKIYLFILPAASFCIGLFNALWILFFAKRNLLLARLLSFATFLIAVLSFYTLIRIIFLIV
jgi:hypothetical protein